MTSYTQAELDFAQFTSLLISQTMEAIIDSLVDQEKKVAELTSYLQLSEKDFSQKFVSESEVRAQVLALFPHSSDENKSIIDPGCPYHPADKEKKEFPAIHLLTGYIMSEGDWEKSPTKESPYILTQQGYNNICDKLRANISIKHRNSLQNTLKNGIPRVYVDHGRISAKLTLRMEAQERPALNSPLIGTPPAENLLVAQRLLVRPINTRGPEYLALKTDVTSEIEVTFKTIVP